MVTYRNIYILPAKHMTMSLAKIVDGLFRGIGKLLLGNSYELEDWQKSNPDNPIDAMHRDTQDRREDSSIKTIENHLNHCRKQGLQLQLTEEITQTDIAFSESAKAIALMYKFSLPERKPREDSTSPTAMGPLTPSASTTYSLAIRSYSQYTNPDSLFHQEFRACTVRDNVVVELLTPYTLVSESDMQAYTHILEQVISPTNNMTLAKAVAVSRDIARNLKGGISLVGTTTDTREEARTIPELMSHIVEQHLSVPNDAYPSNPLSIFYETGERVFEEPEQEEPLSYFFSTSK